MRLIEAIVFLSLATAAHLAVWAVSPEQTGAAASGGSGADRITLTASNATQTAMVSRWQKPPEAQTRPVSKFTAQQAQPTAVLNPAPLAVQKPIYPLLGPALTSLRQPTAAPKIDTAPAPAPKSTKTATSPTRPKARRAASAPAQPKRLAIGSGQQAQRGVSGASAAQAEKAKRNNALRAKWGAGIHAKVQRNMRYPRGSSASGTTKLALQVARNGKLKTLQLVRSSGSEALDKAALRAVQRAGRFAKAPKGLEAEAYAFSLSLTFER